MTDLQTHVHHAAPLKPDELRAMREKLGLSQRELAALLDVKQKTVWMWETQDKPAPVPVSLAMRWLDAQSQGNGST